MNADVWCEHHGCFVVACCGGKVEERGSVPVLGSAVTVSLSPLFGTAINSREVRRRFALDAQGAFSL